MYGLNKEFAAPHTGIVLAISDLIAPVVITLASLLIAGVIKTGSVFLKLFTAKKPTTAHTHFAHQAPHVALVVVPGNFITEAFKTW